MTVQLEKEELMEENFYPEKQIDEKKYSCQILLEKTTLHQANDKTFPTDARLIWYKVDGTEYIDLTRCRKTVELFDICLLYTSPSPRDGLLSRMPSSA